ncbi:amidohydrolase family protein [Streptomyces mirabilis]|uniref:amidohydrolase family protein n=1 Tax=Streptomyces mirabilis TaxID=68239 RepID=UPI0036AF9234
MADFARTRRRLPGGDLSPATALTLDRVRLGAGGPLVRLRVAGGRVTHVVVEEGTGGRARPAGGERVLDLEGRVLLPGLWDAHVHMAEWASSRHRLDLSGTASARAVADIVRERGGGASGTVLFGYGFRDGLRYVRTGSAGTRRPSGARRFTPWARVRSYGLPTRRRSGP